MNRCFRWIPRTERYSGNYTNRIVETAGDAVIFADRDRIIRLWNRAAEGIFAYFAAFLSSSLNRSASLL